MPHEHDIEMMKHADRRLEKHFARAPSATDPTLKKYRSRLRGAAVHVRTAGLVQFTAFLESKAQKESAERFLLDDAWSWLCESSVTSEMVPATPTSGGATSKLLTMTTQQLAVLESECVEYLDRLARLLEGRYKALEAEDERQRVKTQKRENEQAAQRTRPAPANEERGV